MNLAQHIGDLLLRIDTLEEALRCKGIAVPEVSSVEDPRLALLTEQLRSLQSAREAEARHHQGVIAEGKRRIEGLQVELAQMMTERNAALDKAAKAAAAAQSAATKPAVEVPPAPVFTGLSALAMAIRSIKPGSLSSRVYSFLEPLTLPMSVNEIRDALDIPQHDLCRAVREMTRAKLLKRTGTRRHYRYQINREGA